MKDLTITDRLVFLAEKFDVFEATEQVDLDIKIKSLMSKGFNNPTLIKDNSNKIIAILSKKHVHGDNIFSKVSIHIDIFSSMIAADPSSNKMYLQWMIGVFTKYIKHSTTNSIESAIRFVTEDLPQAHQYLELFEGNKRKRKFSLLCKNNYSLEGIEDPTNINQYKSLAQLFEAVDPFIEKEPSGLEKLLQRYVDSGQAEIPVKDRKFTLYIPKSTDASVAFDKFAGWCTAKTGNSMFTSYTKNNTKPNGDDSNLYIIINNKFFSNESDEMYQLHFETGQLKNKTNGSNVNIYESVLKESEGLTNYFKKELMVMAKESKNGLDNNKYLDYLIEFGFTESLFELIDTNIPIIKFMTRNIPKIPDISKFKSLTQLLICDAKLSEIDSSIGKLVGLELLSFPGNNLKTIPKEIGNLKNVVFLNLNGNPLVDIPDEIANLDKSNGGNLHRITIGISKLSPELQNKLTKLLPTTIIE